MWMIGDGRSPATPPSPEYGSARRGGSVQKSGLCRTKPPGMEVPYRKAASVVPNRTAGRFRTEKRPLPYQTARQGGSVQKSGLCRTNSQAGRFRTEKRPLPYQTARRGCSVQKTAPSRTKPLGREVPYRKRPRPVPNRQAGQNLRRICGNLFFAAYYVEIFLINLHPRKAGT